MRFILVDRIVELTPGKKVHAVKHIALDEDYFQDHFPGFPVVPGVLLTEMMGQAAAKSLLAEDLARGRPMLAQIESAKFASWVRPGSEVQLHADILSSRKQFATAACRAEVDGKVVCSAKLLFAFVAGDSFAADYKDEVLEEYLRSRASSDPSSIPDSPAQP
jgi:3-hydroxyacyl-[acyl-carrier-protein] dehydratase